MTAPQPTTPTRSTAAAPRLLRVSGALLAVAALTSPAAAWAAEITPVLQPEVVEQPQPITTFAEPTPPVPDPRATSGLDPATGFAVNAWTGYLVHPGTGHLIQPGTGNLLFVDTLIYTNLRYDAATGQVLQIADEAPVPVPVPAPVPAPAPGAEVPTVPAVPTAPDEQSSSTASSAAGTASASATPEPSRAPTAVAGAGGGAESGAEAGVVGTSAPAGGAIPGSATPEPARSTAGGTSSVATPGALETVGEERASSVLPVAVIGGGVLLAALAVAALAFARRRGSHG